VVRPSGTEPKLKAYIEVVDSPTPDVVASRARAAERVALLRRDLTELLSLVA
jgi:phosphomannomutase